MVYHQYGEEGIKGQVPPPGVGGAGGTGGAPYFSMGTDGSAAFWFNPRNAEDVFSDFFGLSIPFGEAGGRACGPAASGSRRPCSSVRMPSPRLLRWRRGVPGDVRRQRGQGGEGRAHQEEAALLSRGVVHGESTKTMKISREIADASGFGCMVLEEEETDCVC